MHPTKAGFDEAARLGGRIIGIDGGLIHLASFQAHHLPALQINGGIKRKAHYWVGSSKAPVERPRPGSSGLK